MSGVDPDPKQDEIGQHITWAADDAYQDYVARKRQRETNERTLDLDRVGDTVVLAEGVTARVAPAQPWYEGLGAWFRDLPPRVKGALWIFPGSLIAAALGAMAPDVGLVAFALALLRGMKLLILGSRADRLVPAPSTSPTPPPTPVSNVIQVGSRVAYYGPRSHRPFMANLPGLPIGTITALWTDASGARIARVHWHAIRGVVGKTDFGTSDVASSWILPI